MIMYNMYFYKERVEVQREEIIAKSVNKITD